MKYANIQFSARSVQNLGDNIQLIALDTLYEALGVSLKNICYINKNDLHSYDGEKVLLPISLAMIDYVQNGWAGMFSEKIHPLFIGLSMAKDFLSKEEVAFFEKYAPIGCRDERTYQTMQKYNILSYLSGCITLTLPERSKFIKGDKIFCVDLAPEVIANLPAEWKKDIVVTTHMTAEKNIDPKQKMLDQYNMYKKQAKLVISPLLHCLCPCIAAGIPVICVKDVLSYRFGFIDKMINIMKTADFASSSTFEPKKINIAYPREIKINLFKKRLSSPSLYFKEMDDLTEYWLNRNKVNYIIDCFLPYETFIKKHLIDKNKTYLYSIWGLTQMAEMLFEYMHKNYPNADMIHVYDKYKKGTFYGKAVEAPDSLKNDCDYLFVMTNGAEADALKAAADGNIDKQKICFMQLYK